MKPPSIIVPVIIFIVWLAVLRHAGKSTQPDLTLANEDIPTEYR